MDLSIEEISGTEPDAVARWDAMDLYGQIRAARKGATLYEEYAAAVASSPDVLGLISWNEFSENTHVEPSERYGDRYVQLTPAYSGSGKVLTDGAELSVDQTSEPLEQTQPVRVEKTPGRNEPCWCGSGKKFKLCHGR